MPDTEPAYQLCSTLRVISLFAWWIHERSSLQARAAFTASPVV